MSHAPHTDGSSAATSGSMFRGIGLALTAFSIFSLHDALIKSVDSVSTFQTAFFVVLFSFVPFALVVAVDPRERSFRPRLPGMVALRCLFSLSALLCGFYAFGSLPMAEAYSLLFSAPIIITLLAIPLLGERVRVIRWVAILMGMAGVVVVLQPGRTELVLGHLAALGAAFSVACVSIVTRKIGDREHSLTLMLFPMLTNLVVCGICLYFVYEPMSGSTLARLAAIGLLNVIGQMLMITSYRISEAQFIAPMQYSQMIWALIYGALIFNDPIDYTTVLGAAVIVLSGMLFIWRELTSSLFKPVLQTRSMRYAGWSQLAAMRTGKIDQVRAIERDLARHLDYFTRDGAAAAPSSNRPDSGS